MFKHMTLLLLVSSLSACNNGLTEKSKVETAINEGLQKKPPCERVPVGSQGRLPRVESFPVAALLVTNGYAEKATVDVISLWSSNKKQTEGYVFTPKGEKLVSIQGNDLEYPCIRKGVWQVKSIEAVDEGVDSSGKNVANVRAIVRFVPEVWIEATRTNTNPGWVKYWGSVQKSESTQWMYQLVKSGDAYFFTTTGTPVN